MDAYDIFKKLASGVKFDKKRFRQDAEKFKVTTVYFRRLFLRYVLLHFYIILYVMFFI